MKNINKVLLITILFIASLSNSIVAQNNLFSLINNLTPDTKLTPEMINAMKQNLPSRLAAATDPKWWPSYTLSLGLKVWQRPTLSFFAGIGVVATIVVPTFFMFRAYKKFYDSQICIRDKIRSRIRRCGASHGYCQACGSGAPCTANKNAIKHLRDQLKNTALPWKEDIGFQNDVDIYLHIDAQGNNLLHTPNDNSRTDAKNRILRRSLLMYYINVNPIE